MFFLGGGGVGGGGGGGGLEGAGKGTSPLNWKPYANLYMYL